MDLPTSGTKSSFARWAPLRSPVVKYGVLALALGLSAAMNQPIGPTRFGLFRM